MRYEKPQSKNPHKLTINQHIFPVASIQRFARPDGTVQVHRIGKGDQMYFVPGNPYFCARRVWDQKAETGLLKTIEDRFQAIAHQITDGSISTLAEGMHSHVTDFYLSWILRHNQLLNPFKDVQIRGVAPERDLDKNAQEILESKGCVFVRPDNKMPGRFMAGIQLLRGMHAGQIRMAGSKWGILRAVASEFVVPDCFYTHSVVPLSPTICLAAEAPDITLEFDQVAEINALAVSASTRYFFGRDLSRCPITEVMPHTAVSLNPT